MPPEGTSAACLTGAEVERLASGDPLDEHRSAHARDCVWCARRVESARSDAEFLGRVRSLAPDALGPTGAPRITGYRCTDVLNAGSQGVVYRAVQESTSRTVAIKVLASGEAASPRQQLRAEREAEIAARLRHPNVVTVFESRTLPDRRIAVVMEYVDGKPLDQWQPPGATTEERRRSLLRVFVSVCNGIHHAHLNGVIHRDLKPDNILVTPEGRPVVLDFGIAKAGGIRTTVTGEFAGTPAYASPEQASGRADDVDALTDVYSLGVILYRLLCADMPYEVGGSILEIAHAIGHAEPVRPRVRNPQLPADLEAVVLRALRKEKFRRYQSAASLARDIERYLSGQPVDARSGSGWYMLKKALALNRRRLIAAGTVAILVAAAAAMVVVSASRAADAQRRADQQRQQAHTSAVWARAVTEMLREALPTMDLARPDLAGVVGAGLARLYRRLEAGAFSDDPEVDQALRRQWGAIYTNFGGGKAAGLIEYAEDALRLGIVRLKLKHGAEHPEIAAAMHELAGVVMVRRRPHEAEQLARDALTMREKLLGLTAPPCLETRALLARALLACGRPDEAEQHARLVIESMDATPTLDATLTRAAMTALRARVTLDRAGPAEAEPMALDALRWRLHVLPSEDQDLHASLALAADIAEAAPDLPLSRLIASAWDMEPRAAAERVRSDIQLYAHPEPRNIEKPSTVGLSSALERLLRLQQAVLGDDDPALVGVLLAQAAAAECEENMAVKARACVRAGELLKRRLGEHHLSLLMTSEQAATAMAFSDRAAEAVQQQSTACAVWDALPAQARDGLLSANSRRRLGWFQALAGDITSARASFERARVEIIASGGPDHHIITWAQAGLAYCMLRQGDTDGADALSREALDTARRRNQTPFDHLAHVAFVRGHVLASMGRWGDARAVLQEAWEKYYRYAGPGYPWRQELVRDMASAFRHAGDAASESVWIARLDHDPARLGPAPP